MVSRTTWVMARPRDAERDDLLARQGGRLERIPAREVLDDPVSVAEAIARMCCGIIDGED
jgi:very-short-patch-repair endonuclease